MPHANKKLGFLLLSCVLLFAIPFVSWPSKAPYHDAHGDVYRGWPWVYGLDQGDVGGEFLFLLAYFHLPAFLANVGVAAGCGLALFLPIYFFLKSRKKEPAA